MCIFRLKKKWRNQTMSLTFNVEDKPKTGQLIVFAIQQMLAVLAATIAVPMIVQNGLTPAAAMFGAGVGTLIYQLFTRRKSPVFLSSSFAFINSMFAAFAGGVSMSLGWLGLIIGACFAGLVYDLQDHARRCYRPDRCYHWSFSGRKRYWRPAQGRCQSG